MHIYCVLFLCDFCRFILLPDCKHVCEATALASWFEWQCQNIEALSCPLCGAFVSLKLCRFKKGVMKAIEGWNKIRNRIELSKACTAGDLDTVLHSVKRCFGACEFFIGCLKISILMLSKFA